MDIKPTNNISLNNCREALLKKDKYHAFFKAARECLFITTLEGKIIEINDAGLELFGYASLEEMLNVSVPELYENTDDRSQVMEKVAMYGCAKGCPVNFKKKNGAIIHTLITALPIQNDAGAIIGYQGAIEDITALKQIEAEKAALETEVRRAQKMEVAAMLAGGLAHDFNNLLFAIMGSIELAKFQAAGKQLQQLTRAYDSCMEAKDLIAQFLALTAGSMSAKKTDSIAQLIQKIIAGRAQSKKHIDYRLNLAGDLSRAVFVYEQMNLAIEHLLSNAEESMLNGGILSISAENATLSEKKVSGPSILQPGKYVKISVSDQGPGIPSEYLDKIFDPYFTTKLRSNEKGHGLGLTIVYAIIRRHKGNIFIESGPRTGTTVTVYLPAV